MSLFQTCYLLALPMGVALLFQRQVVASGWVRRILRCTCDGLTLTADGRQAGLMVVAECASLTTKDAVVVG